MGLSSKSFQPSSSNRKFQAIFASPNKYRYFTENSAWVTLKTKGLHIRCIPHGSLGLSSCKWNYEEYACSDKSFENITLFLDQLPLKIQFTKEKRTLKTQPVPGSETLVKRRSVKRNAKNALGLGRDRAASLPFFPPPTSPFPSRSRLIFALLVLIRPRYTI